MKNLEAFSRAESVTDIRTAPSSIIAEVQTILKGQGLYKREIDGIAGQETVFAFAAFKQRAHLNQPTMLGASTAAELLDAAGEPHPVPTQDEIDEDPTGIEFRLPSGERTWTGAPIIKGGHFTWGELTKNGARLPTDREVEGNLIRLATKLEDVRTWLGCKITITSGYRPPAVNRAVNGARASRHLTGEAADIIPACELNRAYDILNHRWQYALGDGRIRGQFLHLDVRNTSGRPVRFGY